MPATRTRFGLIKDAVWSKFENGLSDKISDPNLLKESRIELNINDWTISLDAHTTNDKEYTRLRAAYVNEGGFKFKVFRKGFFTTFMKLFGMQDIQVGHPQFDNDFIIQGNKPDQVKAIFSSEKIREHMMDETSILLQITEDEGWFAEKYPNGVDELYLEIEGLVTDLDHLKNIYIIFSNTLDLICSYDPIYK